MTFPAATDVVIVGAGPTGLTLACTLAAARIPFVLVDRLAEGANTSRAAVIHAGTLEVLESLEISHRLCAEGHWPRVHPPDRDQIRHDPVRPIAHPHPYTPDTAGYRGDSRPARSWAAMSSVPRGQQSADAQASR
jgi:2-polyprenyl-6-methoxyphenol hydroxylase-like FAD-dependent oxidoreductase